MSKATVDVAIALLFHHHQVLVGWREAKQHQGNKHEFPGGKVEPNETPGEACRREVFEEVGIQLEQVYPFDFIRHEYDDLIVQLHLFQAYVDETQLELIQHPWSWYEREQLCTLNFPKANDAIIQRLLWPRHIQISSDLQDLMDLSPDRLLYWRTDVLEPNELKQLNALTASQLNHLILNIDVWSQLEKSGQSRIGAVHFKQSQLMDAALKKPLGLRSIAACHDLASLEQAQHMGFDAVFLSPVLATPTHPHTPALGWAKFSCMAKQCHLPIFALGGMTPEDLTEVRKNAGYGVAGMSNF